MPATPCFDDGQVQLWHGDCREVLPELDLGHIGVVVADPPYGETSLRWDRWPAGWLQAMDAAVRESCSLWCFGSMRMFLEHADEFAAWKLAQDIVWRKNNGTGFADDRFRRVHEGLTHWYRSRTPHTGEIYRVAAAVRHLHPTQKPLGIIDPLLRYSLAPGGTVLDPFAGSCS